MSPLRTALKDYLAVRRRLGFILKADDRQLGRFVEFLEQANATRITTELALRWATLPVDAHPQWWRARLGMARGFARYLNTIDPDSEIPPKDLLSARRPRVAPYLYSQTRDSGVDEGGPNAHAGVPWPNPRTPHFGERKFSTPTSLAAAESGASGDATPKQSVG